MEIKVSVAKISMTKADAILLGSFTDLKGPKGALADVDKILGGLVSELFKQGEIRGKLGEVNIIHSNGKIPAKKVGIVGLGKSKELTQDKIRIAVAEACRELRKKYVKNIAVEVMGDGKNNIGLQASAQAITEGAILGLYTFHRHLTKEPEQSDINTMDIICERPSQKITVQRGVNEGKVLAQAANLARDMVNEPSNFMTPADMAEEARKVANQYGLEINVLERHDMKKLGMGALLGVTQGSQQPPKFIILKYKGSNTKSIDITLVGKGITFDSGGISLKPAENMGDMKDDMAGGACVIAAMGAIGQLKPKINVMAIVAATENLPSGTALKPADVVKAMNGKTIEIESTDAEGRLTLADALSYANKQGTRRIIDVATLTGACVTALGDVTTGAFTNNQALMDQVIAASLETGDKIWQMPMFEEYKEQNKSDVADLKNTGGRKAGAITAALFVGEFAEDTPWVHLDIAGTTLLDKPKGYYIKGATGVPTRTLVKLVLSLK